MKIFEVIKDNMANKDNSSAERLKRNKIKASLESMCEDRLKDSDDILTFEALPNTLNDVLAILDDEDFVEKYECVQVSESLFKIKMREIDLI